MNLKKQIFADLGRITKPSCILASNTSTLDIDEFAKASGRPQKVIGHHFFSPANVMKLLEIVRGRETDKETIATSLALAKRLGKVGVVVGNCFAFVANRMLAYYMREALLLLEEGATVPQIDKAMTDFGMPVGPFGMQDIAGIDVGWRIRQFLKSIGKTRAEGPQSAVPDRLYEMGRYGQKTGAGWYRYEKGSRDRIHDPVVDQIAAEEAAKRGITRRTGRRRGDHRAHHDGARQRRRPRPRRGLRHAGQRHRCGVLLWLRLSAARGRADVLCGHRWLADGARAA